MKRNLLIALAILFSGSLAGQTIQKVKITDLEKTIKESKTPLIVNFWATWCMPCIEEIPYFQEQVKKHEKDSVKLILVSLDFREDFPDKVSSFIKKRKFTATVAWLDETKADYFCPIIDPKWSGAIPASLFINNKTGFRKFFEKQLSEEELKNAIKTIL